MQKWMIRALIPAILLGIILIFGPALMQPSAAEAILHSGAVIAPVALCSVLFGFMFFWIWFVQNRENSRNKNQAAVQSGNKPWYEYKVVLIAIIGAILFSFSAIGLVWSDHDAIGISQHGQRVEAQVIDIYTETCRKRSCGIEVKYAFKPLPGRIGPSIQETGHGYIGDSRYPDSHDITYAKTNHTVPIAYDSFDPKISALNFRDRIFRTDYVKLEETSLVDFAAIDLISMVFVWILFALIGSLSGSDAVENAVRLMAAEGSKQREMYERLRSYRDSLPLQRTAEQQATLDRLQDDWQRQTAVCRERREQVQAAVERLKAVNARWGRRSS